MGRAAPRPRRRHNRPPLEPGTAPPPPRPAGAATWGGSPSAAAVVAGLPAAPPPMAWKRPRTSGPGPELQLLQHLRAVNGGEGPNRGGWRRREPRRIRGSLAVEAVARHAHSPPRAVSPRAERWQRRPHNGPPPSLPTFNAKLHRSKCGKSLNRRLYNYALGAKHTQTCAHKARGALKFEALALNRAQPIATPT